MDDNKSAERKNEVCASAEENRGIAQRGPSAVVVFLTFFSLFLYNTYVY